LLFEEIFWEQVGLEQKKPWLKSQLDSSSFGPIFDFFLELVQGGLTTSGSRLDRPGNLGSKFSCSCRFSGSVMAMIIESHG
jgi:hypothetical protein